MLLVRFDVRLSTASVFAYTESRGFPGRVFEGKGAESPEKGAFEGAVDTKRRPDRVCLLLIT
jgi:hypothetical protein